MAAKTRLEQRPDMAVRIPQDRGVSVRAGKQRKLRRSTELEQPAPLGLANALPVCPVAGVGQGKTIDTVGVVEPDNGQLQFRVIAAVRCHLSNSPIRRKR